MPGLRRLGKLSAEGLQTVNPCTVVQAHLNYPPFLNFFPGSDHFSHGGNATLNLFELQ